MTYTILTETEGDIFLFAILHEKFEEAEMQINKFESMKQLTTGKTILCLLEKRNVIAYIMKKKS